ncbi:MAG: hypothetical protein EBR59_06865, partial [Methylococcaceae bacterium]|nr:hypothetical protein [Methylococcaceae bacterium]
MNGGDGTDQANYLLDANLNGANLSATDNVNGPWVVKDASSNLLVTISKTNTGFTVQDMRDSSVTGFFGTDTLSAIEIVSLQGINSSSIKLLLTDVVNIDSSGNTAGTGTGTGTGTGGNNSAVVADDCDEWGSVSSVKVTDATSLSVYGLKLFSGKDDYDNYQAVVPPLTNTNLATSAFVTAISSGQKLVNYDFEHLSSGDFTGASTTFPGATSYSGDRNLGTAKGEITLDSLVTLRLTNVGEPASGNPNNGDDPGIATNLGNDADRGFNTTSGGDKYVEVLPATKTAGWLTLDFSTPVNGFAFNLMGRESTKRDVNVEIKFNDGTVIEQLTQTHPYQQGGVQFVGYLIENAANAHGGIKSVILCEPISAGDDSGKRDIFAIDDLKVVVDSNLKIEELGDVIPPTISLTSEKSSLTIGKTSLISFTLSENSTDFTSEDVTVSGGTLSEFTGSGTSYSAKFTPTANTATTAVISVASNVFSDASGNKNADGADSNNSVNISLDTRTPALKFTGEIKAHDGWIEKTNTVDTTPPAYTVTVPYTVSPIPFYAYRYLDEGKGTLSDLTGLQVNGGLVASDIRFEIADLEITGFSVETGITKQIYTNTDSTPAYIKVYAKDKLIAIGTDVRVELDVNTSEAGQGKITSTAVVTSNLISTSDDTYGFVAAITNAQMG